MNDCRFGVSPVNYPDPDPDVYNDSMIQKHMSRVSSSLKNPEKKLK